MDQAEREYLKSQERQRKVKQDSANRYQELLDKQLAERREKSLLTLKGILLFICINNLNFLNYSHKIIILIRNYGTKRKRDECCII